MRKRIFKAEFFDIFGLVTFLFIFFVGIYSLFFPPKVWMSILLIIIGILGLIVDGVIVYLTYLKKRFSNVFK